MLPAKPCQLFTDVDAMNHDTKAPAMPKRVMGLYDKSFWSHVQDRKISLQCCGACNTFQYPPGPVCSQCLSEQLDWKPLSGLATILSWVVFRRTYLETYQAPYNVITVKLDEGPLMVSNLQGPVPEGEWIGQRVSVVYAEMAEGQLLPRFELIQP
jgi:uncharacterized OB-fold protein